MSSLTIDQRIDAGVEWLDRDYPGWLDRVDVERLNMRSTTECVVGQGTGLPYWASFNQYNEAGTTASYVRGFTAPWRLLGSNAAWDDMDQLTVGWRSRVAELRRRRSGGPIRRIIAKVRRWFK